MKVELIEKPEIPDFKPIEIKIIIEDFQELNEWYKMTGESNFKSTLELFKILSTKRNNLSS